MTTRRTGWRLRSVQAFRHLTKPGSKAHDQGLMPGFAHQALTIAIAGGKVAGMAKKRWRDGDARRMMLREVSTLRSTIDRAFDELERGLRAGVPGHTGVRDREAAQTAYDAHGMLGIHALALVEEAAEFAEPLHAVATGRSTADAEATALREEQADLRINLHLACEAMAIDHLSATDEKFDRFAARIPELFGPGAPKPDKRPMLSMEQTMAAYAHSQKEAKP